MTTFFTKKRDADAQCDDFANFPPNFKFSVKLFLKIPPIYPK